MIPLGCAQNSLLIQKWQRCIVLRYMHQFEFLSLQQIACILYYSSSSAMNQARRWSKKAVQDELILERHTRELGRVFVLAKRGVDYLWKNAEDESARLWLTQYNPKSGKDWGKKGNGKWWNPPAYSIHTHLSNLALCWSTSYIDLKMPDNQTEAGISFCYRTETETTTYEWTEKEIRAENQNLRKIPDAAIMLNRPDKKQILISLETENERKSGENMRSLAQSIIDTHQQKNSLTLENKTITVKGSIIVCPKDSFDARTGHRINHPLRIQNAIKEQTKEIIPLTFLLYIPPGTEEHPQNFFEIMNVLVNGEIITIFEQAKEFIDTQIGYLLRDMTEAYGYSDDNPYWEWGVGRVEDYETYELTRKSGYTSSREKSIIELMQKLEELYPEFYEQLIDQYST